MLRRLITIGLVLAIGITISQAQLMMTNFGQGGQGGVPLPACGTGVIDLSAGCTITVTLGLGP